MRRCLLALTLAAACSPAKPPPRRLVVLAVDGMDPTRTVEYLRAGLMPHLAALAQRGALGPMATSDPPESPVAWSEIITGRHADAHGIYDFVHRDPATMKPYLSTSKTTQAKVLRLGPVSLPWTASRTELLRDGHPFWSLLDEAGVPASVYMIPACYPAVPDGHTTLVAGMGTPDLVGSYGVFHFYTNDPSWRQARFPGGQVHAVSVERGRAATLVLPGPPNAFSADGRSLDLPFQLFVDEKREVALVRLGEEERLLVPGDWSDWIPIVLDPAPLARALHGMVRVHLKSITPYVSLYVSPINVDPAAPSLPVATPGAAEHLAAAIGRFHTLGIPEDTKAYEAGVLSEAEFLAQVDSAFDERRRVLAHALEQPGGGLTLVYFGTIDQVSHMLWSEPSRLADYYRRIDDVIGEIGARAPGTPILVVSDHGFAAYDRKVNLNAWLRDQGLLALSADARTGDASAIDWTRTRAYAMGLAPIYVNLEGREVHGLVPPRDRASLVEEIRRRLGQLVDPATGRRVVTRTIVPPAGSHAERAPDLIVAFDRGYRSSDASALGQVSESVFEDNTNRWRADHCIDARLVPALLASDLPLDVDGAALVDVAPTVLDYFGVAAPASFAGRSRLRHDEARR